MLVSYLFLVLVRRNVMWTFLLLLSISLIIWEGKGKIDIKHWHQRCTQYIFLSCVGIVSMIILTLSLHLKNNKNKKSIEKERAETHTKSILMRGDLAFSSWEVKSPAKTHATLSSTCEDEKWMNERHAINHIIPQMYKYISKGRKKQMQHWGYCVLTVKKVCVPSLTSCAGSLNFRCAIDITIRQSWEYDVCLCVNDREWFVWVCSVDTLKIVRHQSNELSHAFLLMRVSLFG